MVPIALIFNFIGLIPGLAHNHCCFWGLKCFLEASRVYSPKEQNVAVESFRLCSIVSVWSQNSAALLNMRSWMDCSTSTDRPDDCRLEGLHIETTNVIVLATELAALEAAWRESWATDSPSSRIDRNSCLDSGVRQ